MEVVKEENEENETEIKERYEKLTQIAGSYGIKLDHHGNVITSKKAQALAKRYEEAQKQARAVRSEIENLEKHAKMESKEKKR